jgi:hypothetical protein
MTAALSAPNDASLLSDFDWSNTARRAYLHSPITIKKNERFAA